MSDDELFNRPLSEDTSTLLWKKLTKDPQLTIGLGGFVGLAIVGAYKFKHRPPGLTPSLFLVQLRVIAQGFVVGSLTLGVTWKMLDRWVINPKKKEEIKH